MARSTRKDTQRLSAPVEAASLPDLTEITFPAAAPQGESGAAFETLNLGHAGLRNECWSGASGTGSGSRRGDSVASRLAAGRLRRPPRSRTPLHWVRPSQAAEARFTPDNREFLAY